MTLKFAEQNFERPIIKGKCQFEQMIFQIDPKQLSDLLDFVKFQNYSIFYGIQYFLLSILFDLDLKIVVENIVNCIHKN
jgi:hypothetical protein